MNDDYLWDKTGEPDPEIQQLEEILGTLRYQPKPLEIPQICRRRDDAGIIFRCSPSPRRVVGAACGGVWLRVRTQGESQPQQANVAPVANS